MKLNGHYRDYELDIIDKIGKYFSKVNKIDLSRYNGSKYAIKTRDCLFMYKMTIGLVLANTPSQSETFILSKIKILPGYWI